MAVWIGGLDFRVRRSYAGSAKSASRDVAFRGYTTSDFVVQDEPHRS